MLLRFALTVVACLSYLACLGGEEMHQFGIMEHPLNKEFAAQIEKCRFDLDYCSKHTKEITLLAAKIANEHAALLLYEKVEELFSHALNQLEPKSAISQKLAHSLAVLSFARGGASQAEKYWILCSPSDLLAQRSIASQMIMTGSEKLGVEALTNYSVMLGGKFSEIVHALGKNVSVNITDVSKSPANEESEEMLLFVLLSEAQGGIRLNTKLLDLTLATSEIKPLDSKQRFRLGVGLAKLGLFDLSLRHVSLSATPWEAPLYRLRAKLVFSPVHSSVRALAAAVDNFEKQGESILMKSIPRSPLMIPVCNSLNEAALALQALPLLHMAGFAAPRHATSMGHSPVGLPVLLSEVFLSMCPPLAASASLTMLNSHIKGMGNTVENKVRARRKKRIKIGIVSGSFDGLPGKIMIGLLESMTGLERRHFEMIAMCFPTPRDSTTDRVNALFDTHVNLSPHNKTQAISRILEMEAEFILFADAALDSRVFAIAHERLALFQGALWGWGGTIGIPTIDYYFIPEILWTNSYCQQLGISHLPQELFLEQVVLLEGLPYLPRPTSPALSQEELRNVLRNRYLLPIGDRNHIYLFPGSVKHLHPEFDQAIEVILRTDPLAIIVLAVARTGRDNLPTTHIAARHDLMHPVMPTAAVAKLLQRFKSTVGNDISRIRILPPLDEQIFRTLRLSAVAVLDSFPVGMHVPILGAILDQVPVVTSMVLQECTNSHGHSLSNYFNISTDQINRRMRISEKHLTARGVTVDGLADIESLQESSDHEYKQLDFDISDEENSWLAAPTTAEEYAVLAVRLGRESTLRSAYIAKRQHGIEDAIEQSRSPFYSQGSQILHFLKILHNTYFAELENNSL